MQPNLLQTVASVLRRSSHTDGACFPGKEQEFLTYRPHQWSGGEFTGSSPRSPDSVCVTFSRRSPQCRPLDLRNQVQSREKRAWNSSRRSRTEWQTITLYRSHERSGSHRREEPGSSIPEGPNSFRVTFSRRSPKCRALDLRNQVQSREKRAWNSSRRSHVRSCNSFENTESSG
jgi:hypothetical protein